MQTKTRVADLRENSSDIEQRFSQLKRDLHQRLVQSIDLTALRTMEEQQLRHEFRKGAEELCRQRPDLLGLAERRRLIDELIDETLGLGPLETLLRDPTITDILINGPRQVFVERRGKLEAAGVTFHSDEHLLQVVQKIASRVGRRIDESSPMVDARLPDGSRVNAIIRPLALDGALVSIRRFGDQPLRPIDLLEKNALSQEMLAFLAACIEARLNILISGGTGSGKTTLLNMLSSFISANQRIVTIEDAAELKLQQPHVARLETRPANAEGQGAVGPRELLKNALRMRPDRIIVGECRGGETLDMLQAMNTGHDGSLTTVHSNSAQDALSRLQMLVGLSGSEIPMWYIDRQIASGVHLVVHVARLSGGIRKIVQISELQSARDGRLETNDLFRFEQTGVNEQGEAQGSFRPTGAVPKCLDRLRSCGLNLSTAFFQPIASAPVGRGVEV
ncbi:CpaF family protein [Anatilimnocola floriformis]|uniref:CpaF family protein n=1 Tax=Anatilimnocola floriformis TaxID=2948575 RepID=UPI0020C37887|nr:CpaF family protein [Anatilimnocola floriformis]